jgi:hypothetical protein
MGLPEEHPMPKGLSRDEASLVEEEEVRSDEAGRCRLQLTEGLPQDGPAQGKRTQSFQ